MSRSASRDVIGASQGQMFEVLAGIATQLPHLSEAEAWRLISYKGDLGKILDIILPNAGSVLNNLSKIEELTAPRFSKITLLAMKDEWRVKDDEWQIVMIPSGVTLGNLGPRVRLPAGYEFMESGLRELPIRSGEIAWNKKKPWVYGPWHQMSKYEHLLFEAPRIPIPLRHMVSKSIFDPDELVPSIGQLVYLLLQTWDLDKPFAMEAGEVAISSTVLGDNGPLWAGRSLSDPDCITVHWVQGGERNGLLNLVVPPPQVR